MQKTTNASHVASGLSVIIIPLSLSLDSVDDMYYGCSHKMLIKVKHHYFPRSTGEGLHSMYTNLCAVKATRNKDNYDLLSFNHFCAYTGGWVVWRVEPSSPQREGFLRDLV
ncbi:hypothetical protein CgunFtcFv8_022317 [Champsocephalus gunnari]|uniref:Uncharacterized protein n=1 Tax=Champsocephalus gunnari TaxID=52237 RepID=A0AAN8DPF6_CHAGU|nr:hypothetical protein CgunFtcFv8_022317 [Champsocephalus gunnari]